MQAHFPEPRLIFTGRRSGTRTLVLAESKELWLSDEPLAALCRLAAARVGGGNGWCRLKALTVCRLRAAFNECDGPQAGMRWIESRGARYRLTVAAQSIAVRPEVCTTVFSQRLPRKAVKVLAEHGLKSDEIRARFS